VKAVRGLDRICRRLRLLGKVDGFAGGGGAAGGIEDFGDDEVGFKGGEDVRFGSFEEYGAEVSKGVVIGCRDGGGGAGGGLRLVREAYGDVVCGDGDDGAGLAVDFHVFA